MVGLLQGYDRIRQLWGYNVPDDKGSQHSKYEAKTAKAQYMPAGRLLQQLTDPVVRTIATASTLNVLDNSIKPVLTKKEFDDRVDDWGYAPVNMQRAVITDIVRPFVKAAGADLDALATALETFGTKKAQSMALYVNKIIKLANS